MKWRRLTRLEGMLLGALVEQLPPMPTEEFPCKHWTTPPGPDGCPLCASLIAAHGLVERVLTMQRKGPSKRTARRPAPRGSGRGGKRVGERRQAARTVHIIDADSSARDVALARSDLAGFFGDVLDKHHGGGF